MQSVLTNIDDVVVALRSTHRLGDDERIHVLTGGVSALVGLVEGGPQPWIVKSPLAQLSVSDEWLVGRERGANEATILGQLGGRLGPVRTPNLLFFDDALVILGEEFIAPPTKNYKDELMAGRSHPDVARAIGEALGQLHQLSAPGVLDGPSPRQLFDALRLDPYYRTTARRRPEVRDDLLSLVHDTLHQPVRRLVHGDLSPKNILVTPSSPVLLDWEVIHVGDPCFDRGMMGAHFMLKALYHGATRTTHDIVEAAREFWTSYDGPAGVHQSIRHAGGVMLARLYGKSPVEYLSSSTVRAKAHRIGARALNGRITSVQEFLALVDEE